MENRSFEYGEPMSIPIPELQLLSAMLIRAICDLSCTCSQKVRREARDWFKAKDDQAPFSFIWSCSHLGVCPDFFRSIVVDSGLLVTHHDIRVSPDNLKEVLSNRSFGVESQFTLGLIDVIGEPVSFAEVVCLVKQA